MGILTNHATLHWGEKKKRVEFALQSQVASKELTSKQRHPGMLKKYYLGKEGKHK